MKRHVYFFPLILLVLTSCIGTDFVDEPLGPVPARLALSSSSAVLLEGDNQQLSAQVILSDESIGDQSVSWSSRDATIADIDVTGLVSAVAVGQVWIDVSASTLFDSILVTVSTDPEALAAIEISGSQTELSIGDMLQLNVVTRNANGDVLTGKAITWESSDPAVATIDANGLLSALTSGTTEVTAFAEGLKSLPFSLMVGVDSFTRTGTFMGANGYNVQGTATLLRVADSATVSFGSDFRTQNGPGLFVYLSPNADNVSGGVNLGQIKTTTGEQSYALPPNANPEDFDHVIIYCQPFRVPFGTANLQ
ncbi:MAG: DM13 domain-containing protein [Bacteroidota bacterium]